MRKRQQFKFKKPSMTKQSFKKQCNINTIMSKYEKTGVLTHVNSKQPMYGDFSAIPDYRESLDKVIQAEESFLNLPAKLRDKFNHDPSEFMDFCLDPENRDQMIEMGLITPSEKDQLEENVPQEKAPPPDPVQNTNDN